MAQLGADVEQLDRLGAKLKERAAAMDDTVRQLSTQLNGTWWKGADADAFCRALQPKMQEFLGQAIVIDNAKMFYRLYGDIFRDLGDTQQADA